MPCRAAQDREVMVESSDKTWSSGEGNGKPFQYSCLENPMNSMKRQKGAPSFEKPLSHESEVEEGANAQAEAQKKKDEAEVQVSLYTHGSHRSRNKGSQRPGTLVQIVDCMPTI